MAVTAVFTDPMLDGPRLSPLRRPAVFGAPPEVTPVVQRPDSVLDYPLGFLDNTEWQVAATDTAGADDTGGSAPRIALWFRFTDPPAPAGGPWDPAILTIPGDALGSALVPALGDGTRPVGSVSLQISLHVFGEARGTWIGIDSTCTNVGNGLANGVLHLWSKTGEHIATVTQTAMLRSLG